MVGKFYFILFLSNHFLVIYLWIIIITIIYIYIYIGAITIWLSRIHAKPFTIYVPDSMCIIQPPTHGLWHNTSTPMLYCDVQRKTLEMLIPWRLPMLWYTHVPHGSLLKPQGPVVVESQHHASPIVYSEAFPILLM